MIVGAVLHQIRGAMKKIKYPIIEIPYGKHKKLGTKERHKEKKDIRED